MRSLQSGRARAAVDLWLYDIETPHESEDAAPPPPDLGPLRAVAVTPPSHLFTDLDRPDATSDVRVIEPVVIRLSDISSFDGLEAIVFKPPVET